MPKSYTNNSLGTSEGLDIKPNPRTFQDSARSLDTGDDNSSRQLSHSSLNSLSVSAVSTINTDDLVWRNAATGDNAVWQMNGTTVSNPQLIQPIPDLNWRMEGTGDFNNDGNTDLVWRNYATGDNAVWQMNGTTFSSAYLIQSIPDLNWHIEGTGDFNNDGKIDLVWRNYATGDNAAWLMNGTTFSGLAYLVC